MFVVIFSYYNEYIENKLLSFFTFFSECFSLRGAAEKSLSKLF